MGIDWGRRTFGGEGDGDAGGAVVVESPAAGVAGGLNEVGMWD